MKIEFKVNSFPQDTENYNVTAFTEGEVVFSFHGEKFLRIAECLLVEFAIVLQRWLNAVETDKNLNLYYASMDEEEEPLFALIFDNASGYYHPDSCWSESSFDANVSQSEAIACANGYINELKGEVSLEYGFDLNAIIEGAIERT